MGRFDNFKSNNPFRHHNDNRNAVDDVPPPPGPPPGYDEGDYAPPPGPPPSHQQQQQQPPQHNWQDAVPDTSLLPPPPDIFTGHDASFANNATEDQAEAGERWCAQHPLFAASLSSSPAQSQSQPRLAVAPQATAFHGTITPTAPLTWTVKTSRRCGDSCLTAQPPLYLAAANNSNDKKPTVAYFEVRILGKQSLENDDVGVAVGFAALPYPGFRLPGWHRGSWAVHSDDGHRYVNDRWGGVDFVQPFGTAGVVVGAGMRFGPGAVVEAFFTRDGRIEGSWDVNGPLDAERDLEPTGVQGLHDLVAAVGVFGQTEIEVVLDSAKWVYKDVL